MYLRERNQKAKRVSHEQRPRKERDSSRTVLSLYLLQILVFIVKTFELECLIKRFQTLWGEGVKRGGKKKVSKKVPGLHTGHSGYLAIYAYGTC